MAFSFHCGHEDPERPRDRAPPQEILAGVGALSGISRSGSVVLHGSTKVSAPSPTGSATIANIR
jgi:hypothetical protein